MCIAIWKPASAAFPKKRTLKQCFTSNSDGAGFAIFDGHKDWNCQKGFQNFKHFWKTINKVAGEERDKLDIIMHFRIGTSGKLFNNRKAHPDCTHPFPITDDYESMMKHEFSSPNIVVHNGVCGKGEGDASDTMVAIKTYIFWMHRYLNDDKMVEFMYELIGESSRWLVTDGANVHRLGTWIEDEGVFYSNSGYKPYVATIARDARGRFYNPNTGYGLGSYWNGLGFDDEDYGFSNLAANTSSGRNLITYEDKTKPWYEDEEEYNKKVPIMMDVEATHAAFWDTVQKKWNWDSWDEWMSYTTHKPKVDDKVTEIYDETNELQALVDESGNIIWQLDDEDSGESSKDMAAEGLECPYCKCVDYVIDSQFVGKGDSECCKCGCIFVSTILGDDGIVMWNLDTRRQFEDARRSEGLM